jgi:hypothetical protein
LLARQRLGKPLFIATAAMLSAGFATAFFL